MNAQKRETIGNVMLTIGYISMALCFGGFIYFIIESIKIVEKLDILNFITR